MMTFTDGYFKQFDKESAEQVKQLESIVAVEI